MDENVVLIFLAIIAIIWNVIAKVFRTFKDKLREMEQATPVEKSISKRDIARKKKGYQKRVTVAEPAGKPAMQRVAEPSVDLSDELEMDIRPTIDPHYVKKRKKRIKLEICPARLKKAVIWSEVLGPPVSMRDETIADRFQ